MSTNMTKLSPNISAQSQEDSSVPSHMLPAAVTTVGVLVLLVILVIGFKICTHLRKRPSIGRIFTPPSESEQNLPIRLPKIKRDERPIKNTEKTELRDGGAESSLLETPETSLTQEDCEGEDPSIGCCDSPSEVSLRGSTGSNYLHDRVGANDYFIINPQLRHELKVEVEIHDSSCKRDFEIERSSDPSIYLEDRFSDIEIPLCAVSCK